MLGSLLWISLLDLRIKQLFFVFFKRTLPGPLNFESSMIPVPQMGKGNGIDRTAFRLEVETDGSQYNLVMPLILLGGLMVL